MIPQVRRVLVLGGGSAGFLAAVTLRTHLPDLEVELLRSPEIGIIGVGEGTTPTIPALLHGDLNLDLAEFYRVANPSWKLGIRFLWGPRSAFHYTFRSQCDSQYHLLSRPTGYYADDDFHDLDIASALMEQGKAFLRRPDGFPLVERDASYHLENETFVSFLEATALQRGVTIRDGTVVDVVPSERGVERLRLASGEDVTADLFVDCSGFRSALLGKTLGEPFLSFAKSLFCDRAVVGGWNRTSEPVLPYTIAETMNAGWCWQIEHEHRINRGYVYSSAFLSDDEAAREFLGKNPHVERTRVVRFVSGRYRDSWVKNVAAVGNSSGFVEPLESTSLAMIATECQQIALTLADSPERHVGPSQIRQFNRRTARGWDAIRDFLAVHYRFNRRLDTPFCRACLADVDLGGAAEVVEHYQENGPSLLWKHTLLDRFDQFKIDGYWTLLVGQQVPHHARYVVPPAERDAVQRIREAQRRKASSGLTVPEALACVRSPQWTWSNAYYRESPK